MRGAGGGGQEQLSAAQHSATGHDTSQYQTKQRDSTQPTTTRFSFALRLPLYIYISTCFSVSHQAIFRPPPLPVSPPPCPSVCPPVRTTPLFSPLLCPPPSLFIIPSLSPSLSHFYFPASGQAVVTGFVPSPLRFLPSILSRIGFTNPTARRFFNE